VCNAEVRKAMVECRVAVLRRKHKRRMAAVLTMLCLITTVSLGGVAAALIGERQGSVAGLYGSTMLLEDAGGYVLVGVIAFSLAVVITVLCIRYLEK